MFYSRLNQNKGDINRKFGDQYFKYNLFCTLISMSRLPIFCLFFLIIQCSFWSCKPIIKPIDYASFVDQSLLYKLHDSADLLTHSIDIEFAKDSASFRVMVYREIASRNIRVAFKRDQVFHSFLLLKPNDSDKFSCDVQLVNFDNLGLDELVIDYRRREVYSFFGSTYAGYTEVWNLDSLSQYISLPNYYEEHFRSSDEEFSDKSTYILCQSTITVSNLRIDHFPENNQKDCNSTSKNISYCLVDGAVDTCR